MKTCKKAICLFLCAVMLFLVPVKGYAAEGIVFGMAEEVILPFLAALFGLKSAYEISSKNDLVSYNNELFEALQGKLGATVAGTQITEWVFNAVKGQIEQNSVIWQKFRELCMENYVVASGNIVVPSDNIYSVPSFEYYPSESFDSYYNASGAWSYYQTSNKSSFTNVYKTAGQNAYTIVRASEYSGTVVTRHYYNSTYTNNVNLNSTYTYNGHTVYYNVESGSTPITITSYANPTSSKPADLSIVAWMMVYGEYTAASENVAVYSDAFDNVLTSQDKQDIIDGTSVIQLYNPADKQNGLQFVPDPEEPEDIKIPVILTADWWNFLQQFGSGENSSQYVNAYNALNGLGQGTSTGRISNAYDSLGISNILSLASDAEQGLASLTDTNIYPAGLTVAQTITGTIPSSLTPVAPETGIDSESPQGLYKLPDLRDYFPFCIPFDLISILGCFVAEPETPEFVIALSTGETTATGTVSLSMWDSIAAVVRTFELALFILALILITRNIIRG